MKKKILTLSIIILLAFTTMYAASTGTVKAQVGTGQWITKYTITDATTGNLILSKDVTTGATSGNGEISNQEQLEVTLTINVATSNPSSSLTLSTSMAHPSNLDYYWQYNVNGGYNLGSFDPNSASFSFTQTAGTLTISCFGEATGTVETVADGITLHIPVPLTLISLTDPSGATLDAITRNITDSSINNYNILLSQKESQLSSYSSSGVDPSFVEACGNEIAQAQALAGEGLTDNAYAVLNGLSVSSSPASGTMQILFYPIIAVIAVIAVVLGYLFMRARGKVSYFQLVVEDQIKDLEGLTLRASKIDRTMASNLDSVKDRLKRLVGM